LCALLLAVAVSAPSALAAPTGFGTQGEGAGQFVGDPSGVAVDQETGQVFVVDPEGLRVERFSGAGAFERLWGRGVNAAGGDSCVAGEVCIGGEPGSGAGEFGSFPSGVAVDNSLLGFPHGNVYVEDGGNARVQEFTSEGVFVLMFGKNVNSVTHGDVCVASEAAACERGEEETGPGAFGNLREKDSIAVDAAGVVYVGDENRVQKFSSAGVLLGEVPLPGVGAVMGLAVDSEGNMYVPGGGGVQKFSSAGVKLGAARPASSQAVIALGPAGELFVYDHLNRTPPEPRHLQEYAPDGTQLHSTLWEFAGESGSGGLAFGDTLGVLYLGAHREVATSTAPVAGPEVLEGSERVDDVLPTSVLAHALVNPEGASSVYHVEYGLSAGYGESTPVSAPLAAVDEVQSVTVTATGGTFTLSFQGAATAGIPFSASAGEVQTALEGVPGLGAGQVSVSGEPGGPWSVQFTGTRAGQDVPELSADASGLTAPEPGPAPTAVVATSTPGFSLFDDRAVSAALTGLLPATVYHFRFVVSDGTHTTLGPDQTFETAPPVSVETESVSEVTGEGARLEATLNPHGLAGRFHFEYGTSTAYEASVPVPDESLGSGSEGVSVHVQIQGLQASTLYHYRVVATNGFGTNAGPDRTFTTQGGSATALIDGRRWEMVSPPSKHGGVLEGIAEEGSMIQSAEDGHAFTYIATGPISGEAPGSRSVANTQLMALRTAPSVWATKDISTPHEEVSAVIVGKRSEYLAFSSDLSLGGLDAVGSTPLNPALMGERKEHTSYLRASSTEHAPLNTSEFVPLVTEANTPPGTRFAGKEETPGNGDFEEGTIFVAMTPDGRNVILSATPPLVEGVTANGEQSLYEWRAGTLTYVSGIPAVPATVCGGAGLACAQPADNAALGHQNQQTRGAVSNDGSRVVFRAEGERLWLRDVARGETLRLDAPQGGVRGQGGGAQFQIASGDGSRVFFTDGARLTPDATGNGTKPDLYMCEVRVTAGHLSCALTDLSVDPNRNEAAGVLGDVIGIDETGRYVYFVASGALAPGAAPGGANLYVRDVTSDKPSLVAVLAAGDGPDWASARSGTDLGEMTAGVSPNGRYLAFMSSRSLTGFDNRDAVSGAPDQEVFEYDRERGEHGSLVCVSCGSSGGRPRGLFESRQAGRPLVDRPGVWDERWLAGSIPGWTLQYRGAASYRSRYLSDSGRLFFNSAVGLVAGDGNGREDVYEYEPTGAPGCSTGSGCVGLLSGGSSSEESAFLDAAGNGEDVFFLTAAQLARGTDVDGALDVYDAHVCSTGVPCASGVVSVAPACSTADSCRPAPAPQPDLFGAPASQTFSGKGNVAPAPPPPVPGRGKGKTAAQIRAEKLAKALKACHRIKPRKGRLACEEKAHKSYGPLHAKGKRATNATRAANNRRAGA
jgi:hypothetical protein